MQLRNIFLFMINFHLIWKVTQDLKITNDNYSSNKVKMLVSGSKTPVFFKKFSMLGLRRSLLFPYRVFKGRGDFGDLLRGELSSYELISQLKNKVFFSWKFRDKGVRRKSKGRNKRLFRLNGFWKKRFVFRARVTGKGRSQRPYKKYNTGRRVKGRSKR